MFDLDAGKLIVIGIVALIAIPSKDLPRVLRQVGQMTGRMRRMAAEFQGQFMEAMREAELHDLQKDLKSEVDSAFTGVKDAAFDPLTDVRKQLTEMIEEREGAAETTKSAPPALDGPLPEADHEPPAEGPKQDLGK